MVILSLCHSLSLCKKPSIFQKKGNGSQSINGLQIIFYITIAMPLLQMCLDQHHPPLDSLSLMKCLTLALLSQVCFFRPVNQEVDLSPIILYVLQITSLNKIILHILNKTKIPYCPHCIVFSDIIVFQISDLS